MVNNLIIIPEADLTRTLEEVIERSLKKHDLEKLKEDDRLYNINQIAKRLHKSHATIKKLVRLGHIKVTASGLISEAAINDYLQGV